MFHIVTVALNVFQLYFKRHASKAENQYRHNLKMHFETEKKSFVVVVKVLSYRKYKTTFSRDFLKK